MKHMSRAIELAPATVVIQGRASSTVAHGGMYRRLQDKLVSVDSLDATTFRRPYVSIC